MKMRANTNKSLRLSLLCLLLLEEWWFALLLWLMSLALLKPGKENNEPLKKLQPYNYKYTSVNIIHEINPELPRCITIIKPS